MVSDSHRVQPLIAHGSSELPSTAVLLLQPSIPTEAVVCAAHQHEQGHQSKHIRQNAQNFTACWKTMSYVL